MKKFNDFALKIQNNFFLRDVYASWIIISIHKSIYKLLTKRVRHQIWKCFTKKIQDINGLLNDISKFHHKNSTTMKNEKKILKTEVLDVR